MVVPLRGDPARPRSPMHAPSALLRALRPGLQVPLANACAFGGIASLVMHIMRTAELSEDAFPAGVALVVGASLIVMRLLFGHSSDAHRARVQAFLWPPVIGCIAGALVHSTMCLDRPYMDLSIAGVSLGGGGAELVAVALLSGLAGLVGAALLLPQVIVVVRARAAMRDGGAQLAQTAARLTVAVWGIAFGISGVACGLAQETEFGTSATIMAVAALGLTGQGLRAWLGRQPVLQQAPVPYR
jgi:hypothetical protein